VVVSSTLYLCLNSRFLAVFASHCFQSVPAAADWVHIAGMATEGKDDRTEECLVRSSHTPAITRTNRCHLFLTLEFGDQHFCGKHQ
jgi:hypothetical protein